MPSTQTLIMAVLANKLYIVCIYLVRKKKPCKQNVYRALKILKVVPPGIEPGTHGFSVRCSTN